MILILRLLIMKKDIFQKLVFILIQMNIFLDWLIMF